MPKELRLDVAITVPDDVLEQAEAIAKAKPAIKALIEALTKHCGAENVRGDVTLVTPRGSAKAEDAGPTLPLRGATAADAAAKEAPGVKSVSGADASVPAAKAA